MTIIPNDQYTLLSVEMIRPDPDQPRKTFKEDDLQELATSIQNIGLIHPIVVREADATGIHHIIVGERRFRAALSLELKAIPAIIRNYDSDTAYLEAQLVENLPGYREGINDLERAQGLARFIAGFPSQSEAAKRLGKTQAWVSQMIEILSLPPEIKALKDAGMIKDRVSLINLKRLVEKAPETADALIQKAKSGEKITRAQVSHELAPFAKRKKHPPGEQSALSLVRTSPATESTAQPPTSETSVSSPLSATDNVGRIEPGIPSSASQPDTEGKPVITRKPRNREKYSKVAKLLGMMEDADPELMLEKLMDEYLSLKGMAA